MWNDGPGQYVFTFTASGLQQGSVVQRHDVQLLPPSGGPVVDHISHRFGANDVNRFLVQDVAIFGTVRGQKGRTLDTCEKSMALASIRYSLGGPANDLTVTVTDGAGNAASQLLKEGDTFTLPRPLPIASGIAIGSDMASGLQEFPIGQAITWDLVYTFVCV